ncbi:SurA N-terminal domain-containing protein [Corallincola platygyrae]|uniref:Periplasmic chaperone PpiD n=1 Tax=Corallincola platygyrae TaxID=1193278 RepID=A0ABW4XRU5_9GAMM
MLDTIREGVHGTAAKIVLGLIILSFALAGVGSYIGGSNIQPAAVVNGEEISPQAFEAAYQNERARMERQFGQLFGQLASDSAYMQRFRSSVLDRLVDEVLTDQTAHELGLRVSDEAIKDAITSMPEFQVNGQFSNDVYLSVVRRQNMSTSQFREYLRREMTRRQLLQALIGTDFVTDAELKTRYALDNETRDIRLLTVDSASFLDSVEVTEELLQETYVQQADRFVNPEQVALEYVELNVAELAKDKVASDDEVLAYYEENGALYQLSERRKVAHILLPAGESEKAAQLLSELTAGADFAELAKTNSIDTFSGENGGELDWFERGTYGEEFDDAAYELANVGDVSAPVETSNGIHLIKLLALEKGQKQPLDDVKDAIAQQIKKQKAEEEFVELQSAMTNMAFEIPDTLVDAADAAGVEVKSTELFSQNAAPAPFNNPDLLTAAFGDTVLIEGLNSDPVEVGAEQVFIVRLKEHKPSSQLTLEDVKSQLETQVKQRLANEKAEALSAELVAKLEAGEELTEVLTSNGLAFEEKLAITRFGNEVAPGVRDVAFSLAPSVERVSAEQARIPGGKYAVVELVKVNPAAEPQASQLEALNAQLAPQVIEQAYQPVIAMLRERAEVKYPAAAANQSDDVQ